jgi:predicted nucleotidyltransferase
MVASVERHREGIEALCRRFHVRRLDIVGSATRDDFDPSRSDLDLVVEFAPNQPKRAFDAYFGLKEELEALLGRPVDLIMAGAVTNPYVRADFDRSRIVLYAA